MFFTSRGRPFLLLTFSGGACFRCPCNPKSKVFARPKVYKTYKLEVGKVSAQRGWRRNSLWSIDAYARTYMPVKLTRLEGVRLLLMAH